MNPIGVTTTFFNRPARHTGLQTPCMPYLERISGNRIKMYTQLFNWRTLLTSIAIAIVTGTLFFSNYIAKKIAADEKIKVEQWIEAAKDYSNPNSTATILASKVLTENNKNIPMIMVDEKDNITEHFNLDSLKVKTDSNYLREKLAEFKSFSKPIEWQSPVDSTQVNKLYYGESSLLKEVRYYPLLQLLIVALFIIITLITISTRNKSTQNQVWAGMAKETAHQLGTPLSSLQGWIEILKDSPGNEKISAEMSKDIERLKLVSDRFGKIGSKPQLEEVNILEHINTMVQYIRRRAPEKVQFIVNSFGETDIPAMINPHLFDWVIENLLKNALDAMDGSGKITIAIRNEKAQTLIDVSDTGKGISKQNIPKVFKPGFTTKKRGWGLGLSLSKRIIDQYHKGDLFVKHSEPGKGTTFRIILRK